MSISYCVTSGFIQKYHSHTHPCWEVVCQLEGEALTRIGEESCTVCPGDVLLIPPHVPHKGVSDTGFRDLALRANGLEFPRAAVLHDRRGDIAALLSMICRLITEREGNFETAADSLVQAARHMILHELSASSASPAVEQIKQIIYENLANADFRLADHIAATGFDKDHFRRLFKRETGQTPSRYLTDLRLVQARQLLAEQKIATVEAVAHSCGFSDSLYFSTCFKKHTGLSPLAYRKSVSERSDPAPHAQTEQ